MSQTILVTSGECSDRHVEALLNVPSMDWLRERFIEYRALKYGLEKWADEHGYYPPADKRGALLKSQWAAVLDRGDLDDLNYVSKVDFGTWLTRAYADVVSTPKYEVLHLESY